MNSQARLQIKSSSRNSRRSWARRKNFRPRRFLESSGVIIALLNPRPRRHHFGLPID